MDGTDRGDVTGSDEPALIAHRGFASEHVENTLPTLQAAANEADWIEIDCRPTADGRIAVVHDPRLDRCTDRTGLVAETPADAVFGAEVLESGHTIPSLEAALGAIPAGTGVVLDLKGRHGVVPTGADERWEWLADALATVADTPHPLLVSSFWESALAAVEEHAPELLTAYLFEHDADEALAVAERYNCAAIHPPVEMIESAASFLTRAHEADLAVNVWTVRTREEARALAERGVDGLIADYPGVLPA